MAAMRDAGVVEAAHEPQNATIDFQQLVHFEVHGRNARKKFGVLSFWLQDVPGTD
jgi:hypothetical protein